MSVIPTLSTVLLCSIAAARAVPDTPQPSRARGQGQRSPNQPSLASAQLVIFIDRFDHTGGLRPAKHPLLRRWASLHQQPGLVLGQLERGCVRIASAHQMRQRAVTGGHERPRRGGATGTNRAWVSWTSCFFEFGRIGIL